MTTTATSAPEEGTGDPLAALRAAARARTAEREASRAEHAQRRRTDAGRPRRSVAELREIAARGQAELGGSGIGADDEASAEQVIAWAVREFGTKIGVASSMTDAILPHLVSTHAPWVDILFLDTGYHFPETLGTRDAVASTLNVNLVNITPRETVAEQDASRGKDLFARDPGECCRLRKVEPLHETLGGYEVWVAGVRRDESWTRAQTPLVTFDEKNGLVKINPIAAWTYDDAVAYAEKHQVIVNPLLNDGYPSIGCAPCTQRVAPGADPRSGRWAGLDKTECGINE